MELTEEQFIKALQLYTHYEYIDWSSRAKAYKGTTQWCEYVAKNILKLLTLRGEGIQ